MICTVASTNSRNVPIQKSSVSSALSPRPVKNETTSVPTVVKNASSATDARRPIPSTSSSSAIPGCSIESELVTAAKNSRKKNAHPKNAPAGILENTSGSTLKPSPKVPIPATPATPRNATAAGTVISPPNPTSQNSLALVAVRPLSTTSSSFRT